VGPFCQEIKWINIEKPKKRRGGGLGRNGWFFGFYDSALSNSCDPVPMCTLLG